MFLENAGGSQVPQCVVDGVNQALALRWRTELGPRHVAAARGVIGAVLNVCGEARGGEGSGAEGSVVLGASASGLLRSLGNSYAEQLHPGDEVCSSIFAEHRQREGRPLPYWPWPRSPP